MFYNIYLESSFLVLKFWMKLKRKYEEINLLEILNFELIFETNINNEQIDS